LAAKEVKSLKSYNSSANREGLKNSRDMTKRRKKPRCAASADKPALTVIFTLPPNVINYLYIISKPGCYVKDAKGGKQ
jgi:hypothetical protein